jgi:hypothetical protein
LFQTWREGTGRYHFDVPDGIYELQIGSTRDNVASLRTERREVLGGGIDVEFTPQTPVSAIRIRRVHPTE